MVEIIMYATAVCPYCRMAEALLLRKGATFRKIRVDLHPQERVAMQQRSNGRRTVPQIFINDYHVGGFDDLVALDRNGELDFLLQV